LLNISENDGCIFSLLKMPRPKDEGKSQTFRVSMEQAHFLRLTALALHDLERNNQGHMWALVRGLGDGDYVPVRIRESPETIEKFRRVGQYVTGCIPFLLRYTNDEGELVELTVRGGYLGFDAVRGYYLVGVSTSTKNIYEIPALQNNHLIFLCQIKEILSPTNEVSWQHRVPTATVIFWVGVCAEYKRLQTDAVISLAPDLLALPEELSAKDGGESLVIQREIASTKIFGAEVSHYSLCYVVTSAVREAIQDRAKRSGLYINKVKKKRENRRS
jgi:hypothetical protein